MALYGVLLGNAVRILERERFSDNLYSSRTICIVYCARVRTLALGALLNIAGFYSKYLLISLLFPERPAVLRLPVRRHVLSLTEQQFSTVVPPLWLPMTATARLGNPPTGDDADHHDIEMAIFAPASPENPGTELSLDVSADEGVATAHSVLQTPIAMLPLTRAPAVRTSRALPIDTELQSSAVSQTRGPTGWRVGDVQSTFTAEPSTTVVLSGVLPRRCAFEHHTHPLARMCRQRAVRAFELLVVLAVFTFDRVGWTHDATVAAPAMVGACCVFGAQLLDADVFIMRLIVRQFETVFITASCVVYAATAFVAKLHSPENGINSAWSAATTALVMLLAVVGALLLDAMPPTRSRWPKTAFLCTLEAFIASEFAMEAAAPRITIETQVCLLTCGTLKSVALGALLNVAAFLARQLVLNLLVGEQEELAIVRVVPHILTY